MYVLLRKEVDVIQSSLNKNNVNLLDKRLINEVRHISNRGTS